MAAKERIIRGQGAEILKAVNREFSQLLGKGDHGKNPSMLVEGGEVLPYGDIYTELRLMHTIIAKAFAANLTALYLIAKCQPSALTILNVLVEKRRGPTRQTYNQIALISRNTHSYNNEEVARKAFELFNSAKNL